MPDILALRLHGLTFTEWATKLFEDENCCECGGDVEDHEPWIVLGNWFAHCKAPCACSCHTNRRLLCPDGAVAHIAICDHPEDM